MKRCSLGRTHSSFLHSFCCPYKKPCKTFLKFKATREKKRSDLWPCQYSKSCRHVSLWIVRHICMTLCQAVGSQKIPWGHTAFPKADGQSKCRRKKNEEDRQQGSGRAMHSGPPMSNKFISFRHEFKRRKVMENHYGRKHKDSNDLLRGTGDCFVVAEPSREQDLHSEQSPQATSR